MEKVMLECVMEDKVGNLVYITKGRKYPMKSETDKAFGVINDLGCKVHYEKSYFIKTDAEDEESDDWDLYEFPLDKNEESIERELDKIEHQCFDIRKKHKAVIGIGKRVISVELCSGPKGIFGLREGANKAFTDYFDRLNVLTEYVKGNILGELNRIKSEKCKQEHTPVDDCPKSVYPEGYSYPFRCPACEGTGVSQREFMELPHSFSSSNCPACGGVGVLWSKPVEKDKVKEKLSDFDGMHTAKPQDILDTFSYSRGSLFGHVPDVKSFAEGLHKNYVRKRVTGDKKEQLDYDIEKFWKEATATGHISREFSAVITQFIKDYIYLG